MSTVSRALVSDPRPMNILSVDLEDWNQLAYRRFTGELPAQSNHSLDRQVNALLALLADLKTRATFFVLGETAKANPSVVKRVAAEGHEIASHGYAHKLVHALTREQFTEDTRLSKEILENIAGKRLSGYRAAEFSIDRTCLWALEVLAELGFAYDSSVFPVRHRRYGIKDFHPQPASYSLPNGLSIAEFPMAVGRRFGATWPIAGGGYFRLFPKPLLRRAIAGFEKEKMPAVTYVHPAEFDPERLRIFETIRPKDPVAFVRGAFFGFHQNLGRKSMPGKLRALLSNFRFGSFADFLEGAELSERRDLLPAAG